MEPSAEGRQRIEQATHDQWTEFVCRSARAVLGEDWREDFGAISEKELPNNLRVQWLSDQVEQWTKSRSFIESQTRSWIADRCRGEIDDNELWDYRLHDDWVRKSISRDESFLTFVQSQLAGDLLLEEPETRLGTATWYRSRSLSDGAKSIYSPPAVQKAVRVSPTLEDLPACLKWTSLRRMPWLYCDPSESQRARLIDLEASMVSVLRTEQQDWERLVRENVVAEWHRSRSSWPMPTPEDITFNLSTQRLGTSADGSWDPHPSFTFSSPWRYSEPWTVILDFDIRGAESIAGQDLITLVRQQSSCSDSSTIQQHCGIYWQDGKIVVRMIHSLPHCYLEFETEPAFGKRGGHTLAIVYDGFPSVDSIRVWGDGRWLPSRALHDQLVRDFASSEMQLIEIAPSDSPILINQLECYRSAVTALELEGWRQASAWKDWESCSEGERQASREHYARRVDSQWRYQRESLLFYVDSFASVISRVGMVPQADSESREAIEMPASMVEMFGSEVEGRRWPLENKWSSEQRRRLAIDCKDRLAGTLSEREVARQWRRMLASTNTGDGERASEQQFDLVGLSKGWTVGWNRRELICGMIFSNAWLATALDSTP